MRTRSYFLSIASIAVAGLFAGPAAADDTLVEVPSPHSVSQTMDRLEQAVEAAGATVFARIDHQKGGRTVGMDIPDNELLIFGNPRLGTPVIRDAQAAGLDLPIRVIAVETPDGTVLIYRAPAAIGEKHGLAPDHPSIALMTGALKNLTAKAAEQ
ncbi:DUF302 domain-containing protein [Nitratireductor sp. XY-223]|uniref:DUF302 domain-containing protein n=1 Tax=Nitratireductor sp. XY-223 TaxID=2561926 RepID=UPI0010AAD0C0|nr:DUF302 domain-containing protein [Nitratireductor sp. XY-223]